MDVLDFAVGVRAREFRGLVLLDVMLLTSRSWILATAFVVTCIWGKRAFVDSGFVRFVARRGPKS